MIFKFQVSNRKKCMSFPIDVEADSDTKALHEAFQLYPTKDGWEVQFLEEKPSGPVYLDI